MGHFDCFHVLATINNAAVNMRAQDIFSTLHLYSLWLDSQNWSCWTQNNNCFLIAFGLVIPEGYEKIKVAPAINANVSLTGAW